MAMTAIAAIGAVALSLLVTSASAQTAGQDRSARSSASEAFAQAQPQRARTRIRVSPRCFYRTRALDYPPPYECEAPGPGFVRQCDSWIAPEARPSGTVLVPHMRCWWQRG
jgi:hypothetical protein